MSFPRNNAGLALSLFMALVLGTDNHNLAVSFNYLAFIAHRLYRRSDFHIILLSQMVLLATFIIFKIFSLFCLVTI